VKRNLADLARVVSLCDHPVLIQGDTSVGKTSLVAYLARLTGHRCVRVNNHEHTDIQAGVCILIRNPPPPFQPTRYKKRVTPES
jgi:midasin (ATPase involved in ribosome maturation)